METTMTLRVKAEDKALIKNFAKFYGLSTSDFIRKSVLERIEDEIDAQELKQAIAESDGVFYTVDEVKKELGI